MKDAADHSATHLIDINLVNIDDNPPVFINPFPNGNSVKKIPETTKANTAIYTLEAGDADEDSVTYTLVGQTPSNPMMFHLTGNVVYTDVLFDYESGINSYQLLFR